MRLIILVCLLVVATSATAKHPLKIFHGAPNYQECLEKSQVPDTPFSRRLWVSTKAVIEAFKQDDPRPLWAMINFPLISGPLESELLSGRISDWFEPEVYQRVVSADPICRGFRDDNSEGLLDGNIWFNSNGRITAMPQTIKKLFDFGMKEMVTWNDGTYIPEHCIQYHWSSSDNLEEMSERWKIPFDDLASMPGMMVSKLSQEALCPSWMSNCADKDRLSLAKPKAECSVTEKDVRPDLLKDGRIGENSDPYLGLPDYYEVLGVLPNKVCEQNSSGDYKVTKCFSTKTHLYRNYRAGVHAIYEGEYIGPIKFFDTENELKEFLRVYQ